LSFTVLGFTYGMLRIACSFILVMVTVGILRVVLKGVDGPEPAMEGPRCAAGCGGDGADVYLETFTVFRGMLPLILVGAALGVGLELLGPRSYLMNSLTGKGLAGVITWIAIGVPLYFCNGAEVLFLRPLVSHGFPLGTAVGFSLTSTAVCTTAMAMFLRIIGTRLTVILGACVFVVSCVLAVLINAAF
ncbi:MAG TPA: permease, partial [Deltaproteobacteria bacterium]|nr:permease [Deltaproteobacteria bacterium]